MNNYSGASKDAISSHYDIDNNFYKIWLDETMTYSSALWDTPSNDSNESLETAQYRKIDYHIDNILSDNNSTILDIGCGWGSVLDRLVSRIDNIKVDGLTLSAEQYHYVSEKYQENDNVKVHIESWEHFTPANLYDGIVSIGAFEHFAKCGTSREEKVEIYKNFFSKCSSMLDKNGKMSLQTIVYENYNDKIPNKFVEEIFPESDLPRIADIMQAIEMKFELVSFRNDRLHYMKTLQCWYNNLTRNKELIIEIYGEPLFSKYQKYLGIFILGFKSGTVNLSRLHLQKL